MQFLNQGDKRHSLPYLTQLCHTAGSSTRTDTNRRCTLNVLPAIGEIPIPNHTTKVQKRQINSRKQRVPHGPDLLRKFDVALTANRDELVLWVEESLTTSEHELNQQLEQLALGFKDDLRKASNLEKVLQKPLGSEEIEMGEQTPTSKEKDKAKKEDPLFENRMAEVDEILKHSEGALGKLWKKWTEIQTEIVRLVIEELGQDSLRFKKVSEPMEAVLETVLEAHQKRKEQFDARLAHIDEMENEMKEITLKTVKSAEAHQKQLKLDHKKKVKALKDALEELEENE